MGGVPLFIQFTSECLSEALEALRDNDIEVSNGVAVASHPDVTEYTCHRGRLTFTFRTCTHEGRTDITFGGASFRGLKLQREAFAALEPLGILERYGGDAIFMFDDIDDD